MANENDITELLKKNIEGLTIQQISDKLSMSRNTVRIYLAKLDGAEKLRVRPIGKAKIHYHKEKYDN